jgi:hypothetical protein
MLVQNDHTNESENDLKNAQKNDNKNYFWKWLLELL